MTVMQIAVDGEQVAAVDLTRMTMFAVHLNGDLTRADTASLSCHGGTYPDDGPSTFRIWVEQVLAGPDHRVTVTLADSMPAGQLTQGKTLDELYPDEPRCQRTDFTPTAAEAGQMHSRPHVRTGFSWALHTPAGEHRQGRNGPGDDSFGFSVLWISDRPGQARVRGSTTNIDNVLRREPGTELYAGSLDVGGSVTFRCGH